MSEQEMKTDVELLKREVGMISKLMDKFDATIDKLQQVANDLSRVVLIQEQKMMQQDKINDEVGRILERQDKEHTEELKELSKKFDAFEDSICKEIRQVKDDLDEKIKSLEAWRYMIMAVISIGVFLVSTFFSSIVKYFWG
jgi:septin family protein